MCRVLLRKMYTLIPVNKKHCSSGQTLLSMTPLPNNLVAVTPHSLICCGL